MAYDRRNKGYYLKHHGWDFNCPADLSESALLALIIGAKIAEDVIPEPLKGKIKIAVDEILENKRVRHIDSYIKEHPEALEITSGANNIIYREK